MTETIYNFDSLDSNINMLHHGINVGVGDSELISTAINCLYYFDLDNFTPTVYSNSVVLTYLQFKVTFKKDKTVVEYKGVKKEMESLDLFSQIHKELDNYRRL